MISRNDAQVLVTAYQSTLRDRVDQFLTFQAKQGILGGVLTYTAQDVIGKAQTVKAELESLGWTVVVDTTSKTVTIS